MNLMFSIPVHEKPEVVIDQIINFQHFNPGCGIVLHISDKFDFSREKLSYKEFKSIIEKLPNVYINPVSVRTGISDIIQAHISNFRYVDGITQFEKFCLCASNEIFVKFGLYEHIKDYDCGLEKKLIAHYGDADFSKEYYYTFRTVNDTSLKKILNELNSDKIFFSHVEGIFFNRNLFCKMADVIEQNYDYKSITVKYPREEVYFSSYIWNLQSEKEIKILLNGNFTFVPWNRVGYMIWSDDIKNIIKADNKFSVKRVDRVLNIFIRKFIRKKNGYYLKEKKLLGSLVQNNHILISKLKDEIPNKFKVKKDLKLDRLFNK